MTVAFVTEKRYICKKLSYGLVIVDTDCSRCPLSGHELHPRIQMAEAQETDSFVQELEAR